MSDHLQQDENDGNVSDCSLSVYRMAMLIWSMVMS